MLDRFERWISMLVRLLVLGGSLLLLVQAFWISWGVFTRYVLRDPDEMVTEATALLLVPLAFVGMAYALEADAFPKVTMLVEKLPERAARWVTFANLTMMTVIGGFFTLVAGSAALRTYRSGASSDILDWPEFALWTPVTVFLCTFTVLGVVKCALEIRDRHR